ncbi:MAG TPA: DNA replication/repair protein RecF [Rhizomicrobium sp.]|jgi:DNA replication and repair protein RecF|nr:DNA replication/repair protein RecF [Rhizomicrobium sp.]
MHRPPLAVTRLALTNFRSYARAELTLSGRPVVLAGPNGAGKTNLLDAISLLSPGRGLRGAQLAEHTRKAPQIAGADVLWAVNATVGRAGETHEIGTGLVAGAGGEKRQVHLNGAPAQNSADLGEIVQMAWLTPAMDRLFSDSASGRRRFLDRLVLGFDSAHARRSLRFERAMRERARLLRTGPRDPGWLAALEQEMAEAGIEIAAARARTVEGLNRELVRREQAGAFPSAQLALLGETDRLVAEKGEQAVEAQRAVLAASRLRDAESRRTSVGPHVSDLVARHTEKRMDARDCSTGEQKALLIAIVLANAWELSRRRGGHAPLLLLDEIAAHLDARRRAALFEEIVALGAQAWLTGTDLALFENLAGRADIFLVEAGQFICQNS